MSAVEAIYAAKQHRKYFSTIRSEILPLVPSTSNRVLELGCGEGSTLQLLKERKLAEWTCGVDISAAALLRASEAGVDEVLHGSVETLDLPWEKGSFDLVLCLDVLEHLSDPWATTAKLVEMLKPGGTLIASIPNVQNIRVMAPLLVGSWEYKDCGILDKGHLRFFTRKSAIDLLARHGLTVCSCDSLTETHWLPRLVNSLTLKLFQRLVTVQFLIKGVKP